MEESDSELLADEHVLTSASREQLGLCWKTMFFQQFSFNTLESSRKLNREKIQSLEAERIVKFHDLMEELQIVREMYEDGIFVLHNLKFPVDDTDFMRAFDILSEGLKKHIQLQETLFTSVDDTSVVEPVKMMKQEFQDDTTTQFSGQYKKEKQEEEFEEHIDTEVHSPKEEEFAAEEFSTDGIKLESSDLSGELDTSDLVLDERPEEPELVKPKKRRKRKRGDPIACEKCDQILATPSMYIIHMRRHTGEKPFKCDQCFKGFSTKGILKEHVKWHSNEKPFQCTVCAKRFLMKSGLVRHMYSHTDDKPFKCEFCYQGCTTSGNLIRHRRIHTGEKPYSCDVCNKAFADTNMLTEHKRTHTGEKPFQCEVCNNSFSRKDHLRRHQRLHSGVKPYQCQLCEKFFTRKSNLKEHMNTHNRIKTE